MFTFWWCLTCKVCYFYIISGTVKGSVALIYISRGVSNIVCPPSLYIHKEVFYPNLYGKRKTCESFIKVELLTGLLHWISLHGQVYLINGSVSLHSIELVTPRKISKDMILVIKNIKRKFKSCEHKVSWEKKTHYL